MNFGFEVFNSKQTQEGQRYFLQLRKEMRSIEIFYLNFIIINLKQGKSLRWAEEEFVRRYPRYSQKLCKILQSSHSSFATEFKFIKQQGYKGYPVLNSLLKLKTRAYEKLFIQMDKFIARSPFLALIPLFFCYLPALILIGLGPFLSRFMEDIPF